MKIVDVVSVLFRLSLFKGLIKGHHTAHATKIRRKFEITNYETQNIRIK